MKMMMVDIQMMMVDVINIVMIERRGVLAAKVVMVMQGVVVILFVGMGSLLAD